MQLEINLEPDQKLWLTSDTHFGHQNIIKYCARPWGTAEQMDAGLINNWNKVVHPRDIVFHVGDFAFKSQKHVSDILMHLKGNIYLLPGNHDHVDKMPIDDGRGTTRFGGFRWVLKSDSFAPDLKLYVNGQLAIMSHYPMVSWVGQKENVPHFFGHIHSGPIKKVVPTENSYDVGVDNNNYFPVEWKEAIQLARGRTVPGNGL